MLSMMVGVDDGTSFECDIFFFLDSHANAMVKKNYIFVCLIIIKPHKQTTILREYVVYESRTNGASFG